VPDAIVGDLDSIRPDVRDWFCERGASIIEDGDQYSTDLYKSVREAYKRAGELAVSASTDSIDHDVVIFGSLAGRVDQGIGVLHELYRESRRWFSAQPPLVGAEDGRKNSISPASSEKKNGDSSVLESENWVQRRRIWLVTESGLSICLPPGKSRLVNLHKELANGTRVFAKYIGLLPTFGPVTITTNGLEWDVTDWPMEMGGQVSSSNHMQENIVDVESSGWCLVTFALNPEFAEQPEVS